MIFFVFRFATTVIVVDVTGTAVNQGPSFSAGTYNIQVSEGIPIGSSVFTSPVSKLIVVEFCVISCKSILYMCRIGNNLTCIAEYETDEIGVNFLK